MTLGDELRIALDGKELAADRRVKIAFNSYDAQSGGRRLMRMREILEAPAAKRTTTRATRR